MVLAGSAFAYGGGGFFRGRSIPFDRYTNLPVDVEIVGGYGYGANRCGTRHGGFGYVMHEEGTDDLIGAFGGVISGSQLTMGPLTVSLNLWTGVGYVDPHIVQSRIGVGYLLEANAEAGIAILPWFQIAVYGGMQAIGSFDARALISSARYTPVVGTRFTWGGFQ